jgi:hypothetical protein
VLSLTLIASERLALADPKPPAIEPSVAQYHARAAELDWSDRDAVVSYQPGAATPLGIRSPLRQAREPRAGRRRFRSHAQPAQIFNHATLG